MDWNCISTEERLSDFLDGKLSTAEAAAFSAHTAGCSNCEQLVALVSGVVTRMQHTEMVEEPPQLVAKILDATLGPRSQKESWTRWFGWISTAWQPRFAIGLESSASSPGDRFLCRWSDSYEIEACRSEPGQCLARGQPASTPHLCARS